MQPNQDEIIQIYLNAIEEDLKYAVKKACDNGSNRLYQMLSYHMGWNTTRKTTKTSGKRIRPLLVLLTCSACGGDWKKAIPAATAVELIHNFSLIHDDIEDHSPTRRGQKSVWKKWGIAQSINAGDAMFTLAHLQSIRLAQTASESAVIRTVNILQNACLQLTHGQYYDLSFEKREDVTISEYWHMVEGKTAALVSACTEVGAISANTSEDVINLYKEFGRLLGLAFQARDDYLGIWGKMELIGKSNLSDLISKKITLPILYGLSKNGEFAHRWKNGTIDPEAVPIMIGLLEREGSKDFTTQTVTELINQAIAKLELTNNANPSKNILINLSLSLLDRQM